MPQNRMFNRGAKTPANTGHRASVDIGGIAGAMGGGMATEDSSTDPKGGDSFADSAKTNALDPKGGSGVPHYGASGWSNFLSKGQAGMQANELNAKVALEGLEAQHSMERGLALQELVNKGALDVHTLDAKSAQDLARVQGAQQLEQIKQTGIESRAGQTNAGNIAYTASKGVAPSSLNAASSALDPKEIGNRSTDLSNQSGILGLLAKIQSSPQFAQNFSAGRNAEAYKPVVDNIAKGPVLNPLQTGFANPSYDSRMTLNGVMPKGTTESITRDPKTFATTTTTTPSYEAGNGFPATLPIVKPSGTNSLQNNTVAPPLNPTVPPSSGAINNYPPKPVSEEDDFLQKLRSPGLNPAISDLLRKFLVPSGQTGNMAGW